MTTDNLELWSSVEQTNPDFTKQFKRTGGFTGTAIAPTYLVKRATEQFGALGTGWGYSIDQEDFLEGPPIAEVHGQVVRSVVHRVRLRLWYIRNGERGELVHEGATTMIGSNKYGPYIDEEATKKSITDALSKGLSMLGFGGDIHLGLFDDSEYVEEARQEAELQAADDKDAKRAEQLQEYKDWAQKTLELVSTAQSVNELEGVYKSAYRRMQRRNDNDGVRDLTLAMQRRRNELEKPTTEEETAA